MLRTGVGAVAVRNNRIIAKLIDFVLTTLNKLACYKYAICTISPDNVASLKSVENNGFRLGIPILREPLFF